VDGHLLARLNHDDSADAHLIWIHLLQPAVPLNVGIVGTNIHQIADITAAFANSIGLEPLAHLVEQHHGDSLQVVAVFIYSQGQSAKSGHGHKKVLVKHLPVANALEGFSQNVIANNQIVRQENHQTHPAAGSSQGCKRLCTKELQN